MKIRLLIALIMFSCLCMAVDLSQDNPVPMISVSVTGYVPAPGVFTCTPMSRLSDVLATQVQFEQAEQKNYQADLSDKNTIPRLVPPDKANGIISPLPDFMGKQALRTIKLTRDGKTEQYDLQRFYRLGDASQNPRLKDGDLVLIEAIGKTVEVMGAVNLPGRIEFVDGDRVSDMIALVKGMEFDADPSIVQVYRYLPNHIDFIIMNIDLNAKDAANDLALQAFDRILVPRSELIGRQRKVTISGQIKNPGTYIIGDKATMYEILIQAGGLLERADASSMIWYNEYLNESNSALQEFLLQRSMSDMTPIEYSYLRTNLEQLKGKYSLKPELMIKSQGKEENPVLHDGDRIYVPEKLDMVWVSGQVKHPGLVPWVEGASWDYYINQAGGYTNNRKTGRGRLIRGFSGNWVKPKKDIVIMAGDTVFVPSQTDRSLWTDVKDIVTLISSTITIIVGVNALAN